MGRDIHIHIVKYDKEDNLYKELKLFKPGEEYHYTENGEKIIDNLDYERVSIYNGRNYEMFDGMKDGDDIDGYGNFPWYPIAMNSLEQDLKEKIEKCMHTSGYYDFYEISLAEMKAYILEHPKVTDYDSPIWDNWKAEDLEPKKDNPIKYLFTEICNYINFADDEWDWTPMSQYKIIFFFDC